MQFNEQQIGELLDELWQERQPLFERLRGRRLLTNLASNQTDDNVTGTWLPPPYDESTIVLKSLIGDVSDVLDNYTARLAGNEPQVAVIPVPVPGRENISERVEKNAAEQERVLSAMWNKVGGRAAQRKAAYSQSWGRVGWYLTLPRDASWGLPDRLYFEDLTDDEIEEMHRKGTINPEPEDDGRFQESAETWFARRKQAAQDNALNADSLFTLEEFPPDMVLPRYDLSGTAHHTLKYGFVVAEVPATDFTPGKPLARAAARLAGKTTDKDIERYGIYINSEGAMAGGIPAGGTEGDFDNSRKWTLARFVTRDEIYYYVTESPQTRAGQIVFYEQHGAGMCPLIPVPAKLTDSMSPGAEFSSPMESIFAQTPLINQIETVLSNVATWNALGRWYIVQPTGFPLLDDDGNLITLTQEDLIGGDPARTQVSMGEIKQLTIDANFLQSLLAMYLDRYDQSKPSPITEGVAGAAAAAWQVRQLLEQSTEVLNEPVDNHAEAVKQIMLIWIRWLRMIDTPIYAFSAPGRRRTDQSARGLIEFDPENLTTSIVVDQSVQSAQQRVVLKQAALEELQAGRIDEFTYYEQTLHPDPEDAIIRAWAQRAVDIVMIGNTEQVDPDAVLHDIVRAVRGRVTVELLNRSPNFALAQAEQMAQLAALAAQPQLQATQESTADAAGRGNVAETVGAREPAIGMGIDIPSTPAARAP
jgi:nucleotide-binding universal stress UspA family protein